MKNFLTRSGIVAGKFSRVGLCSCAGGLCVCAGGLDIIKLAKTPLIYSVSRFNLGGIGAMFGGAKPTKAPRGYGTDQKLQYTQKNCLLLCRIFRCHTDLTLTVSWFRRACKM